MNIQDSVGVSLADKEGIVRDKDEIESLIERPNVGVFYVSDVA